MPDLYFLEHFYLYIILTITKCQLKSFKVIELDDHNGGRSCYHTSVLQIYSQFQTSSNVISYPHLIITNYSSLFLQDLNISNCVDPWWWNKQRHRTIHTYLLQFLHLQFTHFITCLFMKSPSPLKDSMSTTSTSLYMVPCDPVHTLNAVTCSHMLQWEVMLSSHRVVGDGNMMGVSGLLQPQN